MDLERVRTVTYVVASICFVLSLRGLSTQETARGGNRLGAIGMIFAVLATATLLFFGKSEATLLASDALQPGVLIAIAIGVGAVVGAVLASRVAMTAMPELVAALHSFVGLAAVLVGIGTHLVAMHAPAAPQGGAVAVAAHAPNIAHELEIWIGVFVGSITFTGSIVAFLKLRGSIGSKPLLLPMRHWANLAMALGCVGLGLVGIGSASWGTPALLGMTVISGVLGVHLVWAIGGGDMPVVVSLLNSYSGWAAAAAGFMLSNDLLIVTGALVGSSGAILSAIMCRAMNRSIWNVVFGGFGADAPKPAAGGPAAPAGKVTETNTQELAEALVGAKHVIIVPGYGMAVAQAQHAVQDITAKLLARGVKVRYAIHPVAGRLPGHMNVLLAEANVSYDIVLEMDEINPDFPDTDVVVVIGANDIVNPGAQTDTSSPIYGMPVLEVWKAKKVVILKRSMNAGYAGVDNPLCYLENTQMLFGDAKQSVTKLQTAIETTK